MRSLTVLLILLSAPGLASAQAGRFLLAVGDVAVARGQAEIRAATGMPVQSGDTIRVGPASNAQIRMTDESIVGLRPGTVFRIDAYEYSGQAEPRSIFSLLKGGFRTVTGAIGRLHSRERYAVRTPTATIGIRGTHYTVVHCDNDCGADRGSIANGTYGGVTDGRIEVVNQTGEHEFAANTFFYVASAGTAPQNLIAPPNFLYDRLEGQARSRGSQGNESSEALTRSGLNAESRPSEVPPPPQPSSFIVTEQKNSSGQPAVLAAAGALGFAGAWTSATGVANSVSAFVSNEMLTRTGSGTSQTLTAFNIPGTASGAATALGPINESGGFDPGDGSVNANWGVWAVGSITDGGTTR
ncbi:MAG: FecR domain-containing protein, partial [Betaproteobacteria bacterium]